MKYHICLSLEGALVNWKKKDYKNVLTDDFGKYLSPDDTKRQFIQWLSEGKKKVPFCEESECPNFDHTEKGCPGHAGEESA